MSDIKDWPNQANDFNALSVPDSMPEDNTTVAQINNSFREGQAATRRYYETMEWRGFGYTIVSNGSASVTFSAAVPLYAVGQRVRIAHNTSEIDYDAIFGSSGGGNWFDISGSGLETVEYIQLNAVNNTPGYGIRLDAVFTTDASVPEPATMLLLGLGSLLLRRKK
jgi:hypothetical protein